MTLLWENLEYIQKQNIGYFELLVISAYKSDFQQHTTEELVENLVLISDFFLSTFLLLNHKINKYD